MTVSGRALRLTVAGYGLLRIPRAGAHVSTAVSGAVPIREPHSRAGTKIPPPKPGGGIYDL